jgi:hypothetical protein
MGLSWTIESSKLVISSFLSTHNIVSISKHGSLSSKKRPSSRAYSVLELSSHVDGEGGRSHSSPSLDGTMYSSFSSLCNLMLSWVVVFLSLYSTI